MAIEQFLYGDPAEILDRKRKMDEVEKVRKEQKRKKKRRRIINLVAKAKRK